MTTDQEKLKRNLLIAKLILAVGFVLMVRQMYFDDEPGAIPLLLIVVGTGWYFATRRRMRTLDR